jgi:hypothetical protein
MPDCRSYQVVEGVTEGEREPFSSVPANKRIVSGENRKGQDVSRLRCGGCQLTAQGDHKPHYICIRTLPLDHPHPARRPLRHPKCPSLCAMLDPSLATRVRHAVLLELQTFLT